MKTLLFLFILCLQILNLYAQESKIPNEKGKHAIGIQLMPIVESIFLPDCYIPNLNYRYRVKEKVQFFGSFLYSHTTQNSRQNDYLHDYILNTFNAKAGFQRSYFGSNRKNISFLLGGIIGYTHNNGKGVFFFTENFIGSEIYLPYNVKYSGTYIEYIMGTEVRLGKSYTLASYFSFGARKSPSPDWVFKYIGGQGFGRFDGFVNLNIDLWYRL
jgi:hypothetical protein